MISAMRLVLKEHTLLKFLNNVNNVLVPALDACKVTLHIVYHVFLLTCLDLLELHRLVSVQLELMETQLVAAFLARLMIVLNARVPQFVINVTMA